MAHVVFTSYAQRDRDKYLEKFIAEFRQELEGILVGLSSDELTFFDRDNVEAGDKWSETIIKALSEADVLLCLMSPTYFTRPWCGRELQAFIDREKALPAPYDGGPFIVPIWWRIPPVPRPLPSKLGQFNYRDAGFPDTYVKSGVRGLVRLGQELQVSLVIDTLVDLVGRARAKPHRLPQGMQVANIEDIMNAFDEQQPFDVRYLALTSGGTAFRPTQSDATVGGAVETVAERLSVFIRPLETGAGLSDRLKQAQQEQQLILLVTDAAAPVDAAVLDANGLDLPNLAILLVDTGIPAVGSDAWINPIPAGAIAKAKSAGFVRSAAAGQLAAQMERLVDDLRRHLLSSAPAAKAEDAALTEAARLRGVPTEAASLSGPGGEAPK
jgi:TIR domain